MATETCEECGTHYAVGAARCPQCSSTRRLPQGVVDALVPSLTVACANSGCPAVGVARRVGLSQVVPGVLVLPRLVCARCGYEVANVTEDIVPKITVHGGATNDAAEPDSIPADTAPDEGGDESSQADTTSSPSSEKEPNSPEPNEKPTPSRARKTASPSKKARTGSPSAPSTDGGQAADTSASNN